MKHIFYTLWLIGLIAHTGWTKPLNVVMIMADDVGAECFSGYGSKEYHTPRLDALAERGIRFTQCHSTPLCTPSRVNLLSGKSNVFNYKDFGIYPKGEPTFANHFKQQGYATAVAGKWQLLVGKNGGHHSRRSRVRHALPLEHSRRWTGAVLEPLDRKGWERTSASQR